jgi:glutathione synthase/RimK-type ligase-like ATP-grasp enzyme
VKRVAVATCAVPDVDPDAPLLLAALRAEGLSADERAWDDPTVDWDGYDLVIVRSTWDYTSRRDDFLAWARAVARLANPYETLVYSSDKHYLSDLAGRGVAVVPSRFVDVGAPAAFPWPGDGDVVVKPAVGAGSIDAARYRKDEAAAAHAHVADLHARGRDALVQPYVGSVDSEGERALVFIEGVFTHALVKGALLNVAAQDRDLLYRREQMSLADFDAEAVGVAARVLAAVGAEDLLYARVDLVRQGSTWAVLELELVEPSLFLTYHEPAAAALAAAVARRVARV